jgi:hypothetical protein
MQETQTSPLPQNIHISVGMDFPAAISAIIDGKKMKRKSWPEGEYGFILDGFLSINKTDGRFKWNVNDGDLFAKDWMIYET